MPDDPEKEVIMTVRFRVKADHADEFRETLSDTIEDFIDEDIAKKEGEIQTEDAS